MDFSLELEAVLLLEWAADKVFGMMRVSL